jgi:hypothetical protein
MKRSDTGDVSAARRIKILEQQQDNLYDLIEKLQDGSAQSDSSTLS